MAIVNGQPIAADPALARAPKRVVVKLKPEAVATRADDGVLSPDSPLFGDAFQQLRATTGGWRVEPYFTTLGEPTPSDDLQRAQSDDTVSVTAPRARAYYAIECPPGQDPRVVAEQIQQSADVDVAYAESAPVPPPAVIANDDPLSANQGYLDAAPVGIDARWAWDDGGVDGRGVGFVDVEYGWTLEHEDLADAGIALVSGQNMLFKGHGTAVLGEVVAVDSERGCIGIAPQANASVVSQHRSGMTFNVADAILQAVDRLRPGDVLLIEAQSEHPTHPYVPVEIEQAVFDAIQHATRRGIVVVEAACNGKAGAGANLDDVVDVRGRKVLNRHSPDFRDSGAILVGAASSDAAHRRLPFSSFGSRVDCFAWGENVQTCGDGGSGTSTTDYIHGFGGTSAAAPIVAGAALLVQSWRLRAGLPAHPPAEMRQLLSATDLNTPSANPSSDLIGVMPNLRAILERERSERSFAVPPPVVEASQPSRIFQPAVWLAYAALAVLTAGNALVPAFGAAPPPSTPTTAGPSVDFTTAAAVEISRKRTSCTDKANAHLNCVEAIVFVRNDDNAPVDVALEAVVMDHSGAITNRSMLTKGAAAGQRVQAFKVELPVESRFWDSRLPARGSLMLIATRDNATTVRYRDLVITQVQPSATELVIAVIAFVPAACLFGWTWTRRAAVAPPADAPPWTPRSWSSNLAIGGALLTAVLGIAALPNHTHYMARSSYTVLNAVFAALVALAPAVYDLLKTSERATPSGAMRLFGVAACITLWATLGQIVTAAFLFLELAASRVVTFTTVVMLLIVLAGVSIALVVYAFRAVASLTVVANEPSFRVDVTVTARPQRPWALI
jgi:hypothetical protein